MSSKHTHPIDMERIFGRTRRNDAVRLLGPAPRTTTLNYATGQPIAAALMSITSLGTFERVKAHSFRGCCLRHDQDRKPEVVCGE